MERFDIFNSTHKKHVFELALRNNFYTEDLYACLYGKVLNSKKLEGYPIEAINKLKQKFIETKWDDRYGGFFTKDSFILTYERKDNIGLDLHFILVDKSARNKGLGTELINKIKNKIVIAQIEDGLQGWYKKQGFHEESHPYILIDKMLNPSSYKKLYFIPETFNIKRYNTCS